MIAKRLGKRVPSSRTATTVLPGAGIADHEALAIETGRALGIDVPLPTVRHLIAKYGEASAGIIRLTAERPELQHPIGPAAPTLGAEVVHAILHEHAAHLTDILIRRTGLGSADRPDDDAVRVAAEIAARELGWDAGQREREIEAVRAFYRIAPTGS